MLFYSHDAYGLGHLSRTLTVVEELVRHRRELAVVVLSGAPKIDGFALAPNVDLVRLPVLEKARVYRDDPLPISDPDGLTGVARLRARVIEAVALTFLPNVVYVDDQPLGIGKELRPLLHSLPARSPATRWIVSLDDFGESHEWVRRQLQGEYGEALRRRYDLMLIRGDKRVIDTAAEYGFPDDLVPKVSYTGYLARQFPDADPAELRASLGAGAGCPLIVVATGGGGDGEAIIAAYLAMLRETDLDAASFVVTGPLLERREHDRLTEAAAGIPNLTIVPFVPDLPRYLAAADLAITMGGYSTIAEIFAAGTRAIVVPRTKPWLEQMRRTERLAARGLLTMLIPDDLTPAALHAAIASLLAGPAPGRRVDCKGARRAAEAIIELLPDA